MKKYSTLSIDELDSLIYNLKELREKKFNDNYKVVEIYNYSGNIAEKIKSETNYQCYHKHSSQTYTCGIGTNYIIIPKENYSKNIERELKES